MKVSTALIDGLGPWLQNAPSAVIEILNPRSGEAFGALARKDYLRVADLFEYEIGPLFVRQNKGGD